MEWKHATLWVLAILGKNNTSHTTKTKQNNHQWLFQPFSFSFIPFSCALMAPRGHTFALAAISFAAATWRPGPESDPE